MREPRDNDFVVTLPNVGTFRYGRRTYGDRLQIRSRYLNLTQDIGDDDPAIAMYAGLISTHSVLCVDAPEGWDDLAEVDVTKPENDGRIVELFSLLKDAEDSFAKGVTKSGEGDGAGAA
jgi:hypothetical protein